MDADNDQTPRKCYIGKKILLKAYQSGSKPP
jgi:hypothetical protein